MRSLNSPVGARRAFRFGRRHAATATLLLAASGACASLPHPGGSLSSAWSTTLADAQSRATHSDFDGADSVLAAFALRYPGTQPALETAYWRGLFRLDPSSRTVSVQAALASFDGYLADTRPRAHVVEATTLRRAAAQLLELNKLAASASTQAKDAASSAANAKAAAIDAKEAAKSADATANTVADAKDIEIKRLRDELAKANAELDRIRKRLATPPRSR
jgi:hypothetical protein